MRNITSELLLRLKKNINTNDKKYGYDCFNEVNFEAIKINLKREYIIFL